MDFYRTGYYSTVIIWLQTKPTSFGDTPNARSRTALRLRLSFPFEQVGLLIERRRLVQQTNPQVLTNARRCNVSFDCSRQRSAELEHMVCKTSKRVRIVRV